MSENVESTKAATAAELKKLDQTIKQAIRGVSAVVAIVVLTYTVWFGVAKRNDLSDSTASWGAFGDFFGGLLNPLIAFTALYWLTRSVRLQKEELAATRIALEGSEAAQREQVQVASWTALLNANTARIQFLQYQLAQHKQHLAELKAATGTFLQHEWEQHQYSVELAKQGIAPIEAEIAHRSDRNSAYEERLKEMATRSAEKVSTKV